jgi:hypothetical protein
MGITKECTLPILELGQSNMFSVCHLVEVSVLEMGRNTCQ